MNASLSFMLAIITIPCGICLAQPGMSNTVNLPQLSGEFTLRYDVTEQDVSSAQWRQATIAYQKKIYDLRAKKGDLSRQEADRQSGIIAQSLVQSSPTQHYNVTVSSRDNKLLYWKSDRETQLLLLYDGTTALQCNKTNLGTNAFLFSRWGYLSELVLPLPGASLPQVFLIRNMTSRGVTTSPLRLQGESPMFNRGFSQEIPYVPSQVEVDTTGGTTKVLSCSLKIPDSSQEGFPSQKWEFQNHTVFKNVNIPQRLIFTDYAGYDNQGKLVMEPHEVITFQLLEAKPSALSSDLFDYRGWLHTGDAVQDSRVVDKPISFAFRSNQGSLEEQIEHAGSKQERMARDENGKSRGNKLAGTFLLAALACGLGARFWRRRQSSGSTLPTVDRSNKK